MTRYLLATASVHTTAAAADYLDGRLAAAADEVVMLTVDEPDLSARDTGDAVNVARSRLLPATVTVREREGDPVEEVRAVLDDRDIDEILLGPRRGDPGGAPAAGDTDGAGAAGDTDGRLGSTARALLGTVDVPVVVQPLPDL